MLRKLLNKMKGFGFILHIYMYSSSNAPNILKSDQTSGTSQKRDIGVVGVCANRI